MKTSTSYLSSSVLVGLLKHDGCCPNLINVLSLSKEAGIKVLQVFINNGGECLIFFKKRKKKKTFHVNPLFR